MSQLPQEPVETGLAQGFSLERFNLAILGATGAGKSTLINQVFGEDIAETGIGAPVTQGNRLYRHASRELGIYDTKGLEVGQDNAEILRDLQGFINANRLGEVSEQIHVVWYCTHAGGQRLQPAEEAFIAELVRLGLPVISVITQTPRPGDERAAQLAGTINTRLPAVSGPVQVNALGDSFDGVESFGLDDLLAETARIAPEGVRTALAAAQRVNLAQKHAQAGVLIDVAAEGVPAVAISNEVSRMWARLFAQIALVYQLPEDQARQVLETARGVTGLQKIIRRTRRGLVVLVLGPILGPGAIVAGSLSAKWKGRKKRAAIDVAESEIPIAVDSLADEVDDRETVGTGLAAARVTRGLGDAWRATCEHFWQESFPAPPDQVDPDAVVAWFEAELADRLPRYLRRKDKDGQ